MNEQKNIIVENGKLRLYGTCDIFEEFIFEEQEERGKIIKQKVPVIKPLTHLIYRYWKRNLPTKLQLKIGGNKYTFKINHCKFTLLLPLISMYLTDVVIYFNIKTPFNVQMKYRNVEDTGKELFKNKIWRIPFGENANYFNIQHGVCLAQFSQFDD
jgi:hypothetical protein